MSRGCDRRLLMSQVRSIAALGSAALLLSSTALAHVSISNGPGIADSSQVLTFGVGHGCEGSSDTVSIEISIPEEVTAVRGLVGPDGFGQPVITKDDALVVTKVTWTKAEAEPGDDNYYQFGIRIKVPNTPFKTLLFPAKQTCRTAEGEELVADWALSPEDAAAGGEHALEAPSLTIMPPRKAGWNKYTVEDEIEDLSIFDDAQIVWLDDDAYSSNEATKELIASDDDVGELTEIAAGSEIWVKY
jgi:periplasmic copper chaperone A